MKNLFLFLTCLQLSGQSKALFKNDQIIELTLYGQIKDVFKDRGESSNYHRASVIYNLGGANQEIPLKIKTRGNFRRSASNCKLPPLLLNFPKNNHPKNSLFYGQNKLKLVTSCKGENLVIQEYLVYRLYNLLTPYSFKAQLVNITYKDADKDEIINQSYGILLENEKDMAVRNEALILSKLHVNPQSIQRQKFLKMAVFEYLIGNTDWSIQYQQNIKLIQTSPSNLPISIPYDFDHAGIVRAPYAKPSHALKMTSTRERRYRGFCVSNMNELAAVFEEFNRLRESINNLYNKNILLDQKYIIKTISFLNEFYETINDPKKAKQAFLYPCDRLGTGNVIIKGLKKQ
jgi:hypothetical protein